MRASRAAAPARTTYTARTAVAFTLLALAACNPALPEPDSAGAKLYVERCSACHRLYPPNVMTAATWEIMLDRMQGEMRRRGVPPLSGDEMKIATDYLTRHALRPQGHEGDGDAK